MPSPLKPGDRVMCIESVDDINPPWNRFYSSLPEVGKIYTIRAVNLHEFNPFDWGCYLEEIHAEPNPCHGREYGFLQKHFRKWPDDCPPEAYSIQETLEKRRTRRRPPRCRERILHPTKGDYRWALAGIAGIAWLWSIGHGPGAFIQLLAFFWGIGVFFGFFERVTRKTRREIKGNPERAYRRYTTWS